MKYSEVDIPQTITALTGLVAAVGVVLNLYWTRKFAAKTETAAKTAAVTADETKQEVQIVRKMINGQHTHLLRTNAAAARRLANLTKSESDMVAAQDAERSLDEHLSAMRDDAKRRLARTQEAMENLQPPQI